MPRRSFFPPPVCDSCHERPAIGDTLWHSGAGWICPACLTQSSTGVSPTNKAVRHSLQSERERSLSKRARAAGEIEAADRHEQVANWHGHAFGSIKHLGDREAQTVTVRHGEAVPADSSWLRDTLSDPDLPALDSSRMRGRLLQANEVTELAIDISNTANASNTIEKLLAHEMAVAHKVALEQAAKASHEDSPALEIKRLQISARMMATAQDAALTLQKVKNGRAQNIVVQHVHVEAGGQAVVGNIGGEGKC